jgi:hypothetical protein
VHVLGEISAGVCKKTEDQIGTGLAEFWQRLSAIFSDGVQHEAAHEKADERRKANSARQKPSPHLSMRNDLLVEPGKTHVEAVADRRVVVVELFVVV